MPEPVLKILYFLLTFGIFYIVKFLTRFVWLKKLPPIITASVVIILLLRVFNIDFEE